MASISKRQDGTWLGQVNKNGKRKSFYGKTKKEVEKKINEYTNDINTYGVETDKTDMTLEQLLHTHLFTNIKLKVSNGTFDRYMCLYNKQIKGSEIADVMISNIRQKDIQRFFNSKKNISPKSMAMVRYLLRQSFDFAIDNNFIRINPVQRISIPKHESKEKEIEILTLDEQEKYTSVLNSTRYELFFLTALYTGARRGELIALKWSNVDLDNNIITICESYRRTKTYDDKGNSEIIIDKKAPKTKNGFREIPIPKFLSSKLKKHKLKSRNDENLVFTTSNNTEILQDNVRRIQIMLCKKAGIRYVTFHAIRHTYATRLIENDTDIKTVSMLLGHSDPSITIRTYVHSTNDTKKAAVGRLEKLFKME